MKKIIVISAHPDDEVLGVGGTLLKHKANGDQIYWLITTVMKEEDGFSKEVIENRKKEIKEVEAKLGIKKTFILEYPAMSLSTRVTNKMIPQISKVFTETQPETIYCLNRSDAHSDHRVTFNAVMACTKSFRYPFIKQVLMYECLSETEFAPNLPEKAFMPNHYVDISEYLKDKLELMKIYNSEIGEHPFPRSLRNIEALAVYRGATAGVEYAEAFQSILSVDK